MLYQVKNMTERLQKIIAASGAMSRRAAEAAISGGRVSLNGRIAALGDKADSDLDEILIDGKKLPSVSGYRYIMLNKPVGYVTTLSDEKGRKCITELIKGVRERVYPVGRLDMYSEGLLLLTNDGDFANRLMHPSHEAEKVYITIVKGDDIDSAADKMTLPIEIDGYITMPADVEVLEYYEDGCAMLAVTIHEGRNRQVRRLCENAGLKVERLIRISEGGIELGELPTGRWRDLNAWEISILRGDDQ